MSYFPIQSKIALQKKKKLPNMGGPNSQDEAMQNQDGEDFPPKYLQLAPRSFTAREVGKITTAYQENDTVLKTLEGANHFNNNKDLLAINRE